MWSRRWFILDHEELKYYKSDKVLYSIYVCLFLAVDIVFIHV
jgi:hypothetical protein